MPHQINVSFDASVDGTSFASDPQSFTVNAYDSIDHTIDQDTTDPVTIQDVLPSDAGQVHVLVLTSTMYGEGLKVNFGGGNEFSLRHPLILFSNQITAFLNDPNQNLEVTNGTGSKVRIRVLVGRESLSSSSSS